MGNSVVAWIAPDIKTMPNVDTFAFYLAQDGFNTSFIDQCKTGDETFSGIFFGDTTNSKDASLGGVLLYRTTC